MAVPAPLFHLDCVHITLTQGMGKSLPLWMRVARNCFLFRSWLNSCITYNGPKSLEVTCSPLSLELWHQKRSEIIAFQGKTHSPAPIFQQGQTFFVHLFCILEFLCIKPGHASVFPGMLCERACRAARLWCATGAQLRVKSVSRRARRPSR